MWHMVLWNFTLIDLIFCRLLENYIYILKWLYLYEFILICGRIMALCNFLKVIAGRDTKSITWPLCPVGATGFEEIITFGLRYERYQSIFSSYRNMHVEESYVKKLIEKWLTSNKSYSNNNKNGEKKSYSSFFNAKAWGKLPEEEKLDWIGLDLFNYDTRPSGHISRPTQVNVSQSCFHSLNNYSSLIIL